MSESQTPDSYSLLNGTENSGNELELLFNEALRSIEGKPPTLDPSEEPPLPPQSAESQPEPVPEAGPTEADLRYDRLMAEFRNFRERSEKQLLQASDQGKADLFRDFLEILDIFEFARRTFASNPQTLTVENFRKAFSQLFRHLDGFLARNGLQRVEAMGCPFDPLQHEALAVEECSGISDKIILEELKSGYSYKDVLLRPSLVKVGVPSGSEPAGCESSDSRA